MKRNTVLVAVVVLSLITSGTAGLAAGSGSAVANGATVDTASLQAPSGDTGETPLQLVRGSPELTVTTPSATLTPGRTNDLTLQVSNNGDMDLGTAETRGIVTTARNVRVTADADDTPLEVETGSLAIGSVTESAPGEAPVAVSVPEDVEQGTYEIDIELEYSYTYQQSDDVTYDREKTVNTEVEVDISDDARFEVVSATTDTNIGDEGIFEAKIENVGADTARDATVTFESASAGLAFSERQSDTARINELAPGENATVRYDIGFASGAPVREYALSGSVAFETSDGLQRVDETISAGVTPDAEQTFSIGDVNSNLHVGEEGNVTGTVTNDGPDEARNVVVRYADQSPNVVPVENEVAVGNLASGESASFRLPVEINGNAEAGARVADISVRYRNADSELRRYDDVEFTYPVASERDEFLVSVDDRTVEAGSTATFDVTVTNNRDKPVSDIEARLFADSPLDSAEDEGFAESLAPGESVTMRFTLSADSGATAKTYPVSIDFRYDDASGDSQLSETKRIAISIVGSEGGFPTMLVIGVLVVIGVGGGGLLYRREA